jgi:dihydrofolate synthase/folylpolyglutamate synthase
LHIKSKKITPPLQTGNQGKIYIKNAELAYAIAKDFLNSEFASELARTALKKSTWPGRMQMIFKNKKLKFILDGAHNPDAAKVLAKCLKEKSIPPLPCIFASLDDKDTYGVLKALKPHISVCYPVQIESSRARSPEEIHEICRRLNIKSAPGSIESASRLKGAVLITGSLYLVGEAISILT